MTASKTSIIAADDFNEVTSEYDVYWRDPKDGSGAVVTYSYDADHTTDLARRKGWGQPAVTPVVSSNTIIEADHVNALVAQINSGIYHTNNDLPLLVKYANIDVIYANAVNTVPAYPTTLNPTGWLGISNEISTTIDTNKLNLGALSGEDSYSDASYYVDIATGGAVWDATVNNTLTSEVKWTFANYTEARHYFNSGGSLVVDLTAGIGVWSNGKGNPSEPANINTPGTNPGAGGGSNGADDWQEIFRSIGEIRFGAEYCKRTGSNGIEGTGFYGLDIAGSYVSCFSASGFGPYAYAYSYVYSGSAPNYSSQYGDRAVEVFFKGVDTGSGFEVTAKIVLTDDPDDILVDTNIVASCYNMQPIDTPDHGSIGSNASYFTVGVTQYKFAERTMPTVSQVSAWA